MDIFPFPAPPSSLLYEAVCGHPDMLLHPVAPKELLVHKDMDSTFLLELEDLGFKILPSHKSLSPTYPKDIALNAINTKDLFLHNLNHTDKILLEKVKDKKNIKVKQGYAKCSCAIVSDVAFMTSDVQIKKALEKEGRDVLLLPPGDILLPGLDYGFIGGCCGLLGSNLLAFYGDLTYYKYGKEVLTFLEKHGVEPLYLRKGKLMDRGTLFCFD